MAATIRGGSRKPRVVTDGGHRIDHNEGKTPEEIAAAKRKELEALHEAEAIQLLSAVSLAKKQMLKVEAAKTALKTEQDAFNDIARNAKTAIKINRSVFMDLITDSNASRKDVTDAEMKRARWRRAMGLPVADSDQQLELDARLPDTERDGLFWLGAGYTAGVTGEPFNPPGECVGAGHDNRFREGYEGGQAKLGMALSPKKKPAAPAKPDPLEDPHSPESLKANAASEKRARESLNAMGKPVGGEIVDPDPIGVGADAQGEPEAVG